MSDDDAATGPAYAEILADMARHAARLVVINQTNKPAILTALAAAGIAKVIVVFDCGGDAGGVEDVTAIAASGDAVDIPAAAVNYYSAPFGGEAKMVRDMPLRKALEDLALSSLAQTHAGADNDADLFLDDVFGEVVFDVVQGRVRLNYQARFTDSERHEYEF